MVIRPSAKISQGETTPYSEPIATDGYEMLSAELQGPRVIVTTAIGFAVAVEDTHAELLSYCCGVYYNRRERTVANGYKNYEQCSRCRAPLELLEGGGSGVSFRSYPAGHYLDEVGQEAFSRWSTLEGDPLSNFVEERACWSEFVEFHKMYFRPIRVELKRGEAPTVTPGGPGSR